MRKMLGVSNEPFLKAVNKTNGKSPLHKPARLHIAFMAGGQGSRNQL